MFDQGAVWQPAALPWHSDGLRRLQTMIAQERLPHALMLTGAQGSGKAVFAAALAASLLCRDSADGPCGQCESCRLVIGGGHGDYRWLAPEEGKRAIGIDKVRDAIRFLQQTSGYGAVKVLVISPAEAMTTAAANALLKTLEEPAGNSHLLLVSQRPGDLPATVRSRCQTVLLEGPDIDGAVAWLSEQTGLSPDYCAEALAACNGQVLAAFAVLAGEDDTGLLELRKRLQALIEGRISAVVASSEISGWEIERVLESALGLLEQWLRDQTATSLQTHRHVFEVHAQLQQWLSATRRGLNLSKDLLSKMLCTELYRIVASEAVEAG